MGKPWTPKRRIKHELKKWEKREQPLPFHQNEDGSYEFPQMIGVHTALKIMANEFIRGKVWTLREVLKILEEEQ